MLAWQVEPPEDRPAGFECVVARGIWEDDFLSDINDYDTTPAVLFMADWFGFSFSIAWRFEGKLKASLLLFALTLLFAPENLFYDPRIQHRFTLLISIV